jgi:hypothetical protein
LLWFELRNLLLANERRQRITPALNLAQELPLRLDVQFSIRAYCCCAPSIPSSAAFFSAASCFSLASLVQFDAKSIPTALFGFNYRQFDVDQ